MNKPQVILDEKGKPAYAVIPWGEYKQLASMGDEGAMTDEELYEDRLLAGEHPIRVYRDHRRLTQKKLAEAAGINPVYLSQIETGRRTGSARTLASIAGALDVEVDDLI